MTLPQGVIAVLGMLVGTATRPTPTDELYKSKPVILIDGKFERIKRSGSAGNYTYAWELIPTVVPTWRDVSGTGSSYTILATDTEFLIKLHSSQTSLDDVGFLIGPLPRIALGSKATKYATSAAKPTTQLRENVLGISVTLSSSTSLTVTVSGDSSEWLVGSVYAR